MQTISLEDVNDEMVPSKWKQCYKLTRNYMKPFQTKYHQRPDKSESYFLRFKYALLCPPHGKLARWLSYIFSVFMLWLVTFSIYPPQALPGSCTFSIIVLYAAAAFVGKVITLLRLPSMIGMFLVGIILRNVPSLNIAQHILPEWVTSIRNFAMAILLLQTGLRINSIRGSFNNFFKRLFLLPFAAELFISTFLCRFLIELPWSWSISIGSIISSLSPSIILTLLLELHNNSNIMSQIAAALIVNNMFSALIVALTWTTENHTADIFLKLFEPFGEILVGIIIGVFLWYIPPKDFMHNFVSRCLFYIGSSALVLFTFSALKLPFAGHLTVFLLGHIAVCGWKKGLDDQQVLKQKLVDVLNTLWQLCQPLLFGLVGCTLNLSLINTKILGLVFLNLFAAMAARLVVTYILMIGTNITKKERIFSCLAFLPKDESQILSAYIIQNTMYLEDDTQQYIVLYMTVLAILLLLPFAACLLHLSERYLLITIPENNDETNIALLTQNNSSQNFEEPFNGEDTIQVIEEQERDTKI